MIEMTDSQKQRTAAALLRLNEGVSTQYFFRVMREIGVENTLLIVDATGYIPESETDAIQVINDWQEAVRVVKRQTVEVPADRDQDGRVEGPFEGPFEYPTEGWEKQ